MACNTRDFPGRNRTSRVLPPPTGTVTTVLDERRFEDALRLWKLDFSTRPDRNFALSKLSLIEPEEREKHQPPLRHLEQDFHGAEYQNSFQAQKLYEDGAVYYMMTLQSDWEKVFTEIRSMWSTTINIDRSNSEPWDHITSKDLGVFYNKESEFIEISFVRDTAYPFFQIMPQLDLFQFLESLFGLDMLYYPINDGRREWRFCLYHSSGKGSATFESFNGKAYATLHGQFSVFRDFISLIGNLVKLRFRYREWRLASLSAT